MRLSVVYRFVLARFQYGCGNRPSVGYREVALIEYDKGGSKFGMVA